jgi:hypothetical protein
MTNLKAAGCRHVAAAGAKPVLASSHHQPTAPRLTEPNPSETRVLSRTGAAVVMALAAEHARTREPSHRRNHTRRSTVGQRTEPGAGA